MVRLSWRRAATIPASVGAKMVMGSEELPNCRREASQAGHVSTSESYGFTAMPPPPPPPLPLLPHWFVDVTCPAGPLSNVAISC